MKSLMDLVHEGHLTTETEAGLYCWTCTQRTGEDTPYPCPTLRRAEELDAITPAEDIAVAPVEPDVVPAEPDAITPNDAPEA
jgi:hypothetical protein